MQFCVQLASLLSSELGVALPSTVAFDYPTVDAIVRFVLDIPSEVHMSLCAPPLQYRTQGALRVGLFSACSSNLAIYRPGVIRLLQC